MKDLTALINKIKRDSAEAKEIQTRLDHLKLEIVTNNMMLRSWIEDGDGSGDRILDMVISRHFIFDGEAVDKYRELENRLKGKVGQNILVITEENYRYLSGVSHNPSHYGLKKMIRIGRIIGENFIFSKESYFFPVDSYFRYWKDDLVLINSPMELVNLCGGNSLSGEKPMDPIVLIGRDAIINWLLGSKDDKIMGIVFEAMKKLNNSSLLIREHSKNSKKEPKQKPFISIQKIDKNK